MNPDRHDIERHISDRRRSRGDATSTPMGTARAHLEATPPERQPGQKGGPAPGAHAPHSPASASDAQPNARQRPPPAAPPQGGRHRGGVGTPLEGTYFQAKLGNAMCVQSLDDSLNSAIHITYRISLRSSSLREPRYPSAGVVVRFVGWARADGTREPNRRRAQSWVGRRGKRTPGSAAPSRTDASARSAHPAAHARAPHHHHHHPAARAGAPNERGPGADKTWLTLAGGARGGRTAPRAWGGPAEARGPGSHGVRNGYR